MSKRFIFITGGVCSSLGKGLTSASIGFLLERHGHRVCFLKLDPYLNVDPGTMNPFQHGEVYVTDDGAETDLDLGHYHRFTQATLRRSSSVTSGQIYLSVIDRERRGDYQGNTIQVIPHITDEIKARIEATCNGNDCDVVIVEIGGTAGDIESFPFMEAIRQFQQERRDTSLFIHLTYVPYIRAADEFKTKPTQHSVHILNGMGIFPHLLLCRCENPLPEELKNKIGLFCNVSAEEVFEEVDVATSIYEVPLALREQELDKAICKKLNLSTQAIDLSDWEALIAAKRHPTSQVRIGIVGKYVQHQDAYKSLFEALEHAGMHRSLRVVIERIDSSELTEETLKERYGHCQGFIVPGGFGDRGFAGKLLTAKYCREKNVPYFGICLGMQVMAVEFARHAAGLTDASSTEIDPHTPYPVVSLLSEQEAVTTRGGTMRLGAHVCQLKPGSLAHQIYQREEISERHRHRYEFNGRFTDQLERHGFRITGQLKGEHLCEIAEIEGHKWMLGVQFHPEFLSKALEPHPLFVSFIEAAAECQTKVH